MRKNSTTQNRTPKTVTRGRVAVVGAGLVAALALGSTAAFAATSHSSSQDAAGFMSARTVASVSDAVHAQAVGQQTAAAKAEAKAAADAKAKAAKAKAEAAAKKKAKAKAAAHRKALHASWVTPTTGYKLGAGYAQAGPHWIHKHSGQDFVVNSGTTVRAAHGGTVVTAGWGGAYGNNIVIKNGSHLYTQYGHLSHIGVHVGEHVNTAEKIGLSGSTGNSTGPHLHFEVRTTPYYGSSVEPLHFLRAHGVNP
ncbi:Murein DD-endopeptidase MepM and murein hydrolase activator NlpD, contain LysM domain [Actinacidiphila yanglinensis]|uniref:Murein DD-endopeptidase MepM and murein hydrolase activator NlpD, contain LysM domain n=1 Tax=Actinacidiphila yanglinensis TaxID=310779 RepID=A0A1H6DSP4_9ACTN|nr:M23 family metallopeptidase [Actinacidiphila yanglinensis]SEG88279.1 Murein DD-endopeptidase MepM and murein hydrolase activator NlpD, contain LysM domain [Actinacidiphila yanglinensis]